MKPRIQAGLTGVFMLALTGTLHSSLWAQEMPSVESKTQDMRALEGLFNLYWDDDAGRIYWEIDSDGGEFLYQISMGSGLGSNPVGIDRGQLRGTHILDPERIGPRLLLMEPNYRFQARSDNAAERQAVRDAFAPSVYWGFDIAASTGSRVLVDATPFFIRDARGAAAQIRQRGQGDFSLSESRSAIYFPNTRSFPDNTEVEALLTFTANNPGPLVRGVAVNPGSVTMRQHHSFIRLPDDGYEPRLADPRLGVNGPTLVDYAVPIDEDTRVRLASRHRLQKKTPGDAPSEVVEPIVYYVDPGTPEPILSALIEGAQWWAEAFEAAGFIDAYRVEVLPEGIDSQDIRYNMIHWTHRRTRGYSYGNSVVDPRTGEIIRGVVNLGSLRLRQDYLHGQGMVPPFAAAEGGISQGAESFSCGFLPMPDFSYLAEVVESGEANSDAVEMALDRVRQLSAHEVGHTLGFPHNYLASAYGRESVMDYPAPYAEIDDQGRIDLSNAYVQRIGAYDIVTVDYLYREFAPGADEAAELSKIVEKSIEDGLLYMGHSNNNFIGAGHPQAGVWDNGSNLVDHLRHEMRVRDIGMAKFGESMIRDGRPLSDLEFVLLPLYMHHRFQLRAAAQTLGGAHYSYAVKGDGQEPFRIVDGVEQRDALDALLSALTVDFLALPPEVVEIVPPLAFRYGEGETFQGRTELLFDPLGAAAAAASFTVGEILHPQRMARLVVYGSMGDYPDLEEVVDRLIEATWETPRQNDAYLERVREAIQRSVVDEMMRRAADARVQTQARAVLSKRLAMIARDLEVRSSPTSHEYLVAADIRRWQSRIENAVPGESLELPPGDPIGGSAPKPVHR